MEKWKELKVDNRELELIIYALQESLDNNPVVSPRAETELSTLISKLQDLKAKFP